MRDGAASRVIGASREGHDGQSRAVAGHAGKRREMFAATSVLLFDFFFVIVSIIFIVMIDSSWNKRESKNKVQESSNSCYWYYLSFTFNSFQIVLLCIYVKSKIKFIKIMEFNKMKNRF